VDDRISWGEDRPFKITLDFEDESGTPHRLEKDWEAQSVCLTNLQTNEREDDADSVEQAIGEILGCGSLKLLQSTVCVEQDAIDDISAGRREIGDQLQSIVTGGGVDEATVSTVLKDLNNKIAEMERGWRTHAPKNPGPIKVTQDEIAELDRRLSEIRPQVERVEQAKEQLITLEARIEEIEEALTPMQSLKALCDQQFEWTEDLNKWKTEEAELETRIDQIKIAQKQIEEADEKLKQYPGLGGVDFEVEQRLGTLYQRVEVLQENIEQRSDELKQLRARQTSKTQTRSALPVAPLVGVIAGIVLLVIGAVLGLTRPVGLLAGLAGLAMSIGCAIWLVVVLRRPRPLDLSSQIATRETELNQSRRQHQDVQTQLTERLARFECEAWDEFSQKLAECKKCWKQREKAETRYEALLGDQTLEALIEERKIASRNRRDAEDVLGEPKMQRAAGTTPIEYEELQQDIERLEKELADKQQKREVYRIRRQIADYTIEDVHRLEEQKAAAARSLAHLEERLTVYQLTREVIEEAKEQTMRSARDELEPRIGAYFRRITQDRYTQVEADDDLNLKVFSQEKEDWTAPESGELSRGTVDQLYLAARLALLDLLYRDTNPPLLLDDPFVKFDPDRCKRAVMLCKEIAQEHQVLLFTCRDDYDTSCDWIVEL
jgi:DNA repair exonuclease SbcCD ATPase subunit